MESGVIMVLFPFLVQFTGLLRADENTLFRRWYQLNRVNVWKTILLWNHFNYKNILGHKFKLSE